MRALEHLKLNVAVQVKPKKKCDISHQVDCNTDRQTDTLIHPSKKSNLRNQDMSSNTRQGKQTHTSTNMK